MADDIVCGKLDDCTALMACEPGAVHKTRLYQEPPPQKKPPVFIALSASEQAVWCDGRMWRTEDFFRSCVNRGARRLLVLTSREYWHLVERAMAHGLRVDAFEARFPIFPGITFNPCLKTNLAVLSRLQKKAAQLGLSATSLSRQLSRRHQRKAAKKLGYKNGLDSQFFLAYKDSYQEVFTFREERPERVIVALDFNGMFVDCMQGIPGLPQILPLDGHHGRLPPEISRYRCARCCLQPLGTGRRQCAAEDAQNNRTVPPTSIGGALLREYRRGPSQHAAR
jgi:hypothetical protein